MRIYVGNLSYSTTADDLRAAFSVYGDVNDVFVGKDKDTGRSKGFAFVEMGDSNEGRAAIKALNGTDFGGRTLKINEAEARPPKRDGGRQQRARR